MKSKKQSYLIIILLTIVICSCFNTNKGQSQYVNHRGFRLVLSAEISKHIYNEDSCKIILYVEDHTCASCLEKTLYPLYCMLEDSLIEYRPLLIIHLNASEDNDTVLDKCYKEKFNVITTRTDSIRLYNEWIPRGLVYYGFILDSIGCVQYEGFISNNEFVKRCYHQCKQSSDI